MPLLPDQGPEPDQHEHDAHAQARIHQQQGVGAHGGDEDQEDGGQCEEQAHELEHKLPGTAPAILCHLQLGHFL